GKGVSQFDPRCPQRQTWSQEPQPRTLCGRPSERIRNQVHSRQPAPQTPQQDVPVASCPLRWKQSTHEKAPEAVERILGSVAIAGGSVQTREHRFLRRFGWVVRAGAKRRRNRALLLCDTTTSLRQGRRRN